MNRIAQLNLPHGVMDVYLNAVFTHNPDGTTTLAEPIGAKDDIIQTLADELATRIATLAEKGLTADISHILADAMRVAQRLPYNKRNRKLSPTQVRSLRARYQPFKVSVKALAEEHGITRKAAYNIIHGYTYKDVE